MSDKFRVVEIRHNNQSYFDCCIEEGLEAFAEEAELGTIPDGEYLVRFHEMTGDEYDKLMPNKVDWFPVYTVVSEECMSDAMRQSIANAIRLTESCESCGRSLGEDGPIDEDIDICRTCHDEITSAEALEEEHF